MTAYYYLISSLPNLIGGADRHPYPVFEEFAREELSPVDQENMRRCFFLNDAANLLALLDSDSSDFHRPSYYDEETLHEGLRDPDMLIPPFTEFLQDFQSDRRPADGSDENQLLTRMMTDALEGQWISGFPRDYLVWEMHLRNLASALSRRREGEPHAEALAVFDYFSKRIAESPAADFGLGGDLGVLENLIDVFADAPPLERERRISSVRWEWLDNRVDRHIFSPEAVFAYAVKIADIQRWLVLRPETGRERLDAVLGNLESEIRTMEISL